RGEEPRGGDGARRAREPPHARRRERLEGRVGAGPLATGALPEDGSAGDQPRAPPPVADKVFHRFARMGIGGVPCAPTVSPRSGSWPSSWRSLASRRTPG